MYKYQMGFVILHYNELNVTIECINSIKDKVGIEKYYIVVVDNASPNGTGKLLKKQYDENDHVCVILNESNAGFARGNNVGYNYLKNKCEYICILNNDVELVGEDFYLQISNAYKSNEFGIMGPKIRLNDGTYFRWMANVGSYKTEKKIYIKKLLRFYLAILGLNRIREIAVSKHKTIKNNNNYYNYNVPQENVPINGCCIIYSRMYIDRNSFAFYPKTDFYGEEVILHILIKRQGIKSYYNPKMEILHKESVSTRTGRSLYKKTLFQLGNTVKSQKILLEVMCDTRKRFVTSFPDIKNIHLIKDVGMYPYGMSKFCGYESSILLDSEQEYPYLDTEVKGLNGVKVKKFFAKDKWNFLIWLICHAKEIDVLNLIHQVNHTRLSIAIFKRLNRNGKVYVHCDCDGTDYSKYTLGLDGNSIKKKMKRIIYHYIFYPKWIRKDILWGVQNQEAETNITGKFPYQNVAYMPNGYSFSDVSENKIDNLEYSDKENIILTVGRNGTDQKRTDILLEGFALSRKELDTSWRLRIVGPIEEDFQLYIQDYFCKYPELKTKVEFVGAVYDRDKLVEEYMCAKVFAFTSDYESFGIVLVEAMSCGCTVITSNFPAAKDITNNEDYGKIFEAGNVDEFAKCLIAVCNDEKKLEKQRNQIVEYANVNYSYENILEKLDEWLINEEQYDEN